MNLLSNTKLPPDRVYRNLHQDHRFAGRYSDCAKKFPQPLPADFDSRWHRAQMRSWAQHWRNSVVHARSIRRPKEDLAETALSIARQYRDASSRLKKSGH